MIRKFLVWKIIAADQKRIVYVFIRVGSNVELSSLVIPNLFSKFILKYGVI